VSGTAGRISSTGGATPIIDLVNTAVTPNSYTYASLTVDAAGRLTAASSGATPALASRTLTGTAPVLIAGDNSPHDLSADRTISFSYDNTSLTVSGTALQRAALTGDVSAPAGSNSTTIANNAIITAKILDANVTYAKVQNATALSVLGRSTNSAGVLADIVASADGDVLRRSGTSVGFGSIPGSSVSLTATQIAYGNGSNLMTSEAALAYDATNDILKVGAPATTNVGGFRDAINASVDESDNTYALTGSNPNSGDDCSIGLRLFAGPTGDYTSAYLDISLGSPGNDGGLLTFTHQPTAGSETRFISAGTALGADIVFYTNTGVEKLRLPFSGHPSMLDLGTPGGYVKAAGTTGLLSSVATIPVADVTGAVPSTRTLTGTTPIRIAGDNSAHDLSADRTLSLFFDATTLTVGASGLQRAALTGDVTASTGSNTTTLANIPNATPMAGSLLATAISAPSTPASGKGSIYVDSTSKNLAVKDDAGVVKHGVQTKAAVTSNFLTAISDAGVVSAAQPAFTDISGSVAASQMPALTGDVTTVAGAVATTLATVNSNVGSFTNASVSVNGKGLITAASSGAAPEVPLTFTDGLTRTTNTVRSNLFTGVSGGQTAVGGTGASDNLTLSTTSNGTKGKLIVGSTTGMQFDEANNVLSVGVATPASATTGHFKNSSGSGNNLYVENTSSGTSAYMGLTIGNNDTLFSGPFFGFWQTGASYTPVGAANASAAWFQLGGGSGNMFFDLHQSAGDFVFSTTTSAAERMRIKNAGAFSLSNVPSISFSSSTRIDPTAPTMMEFGLTPASFAPGGSATLDVYKFDATTVTLSGTTHVTTAGGFNFIDIEAPSYTNASAQTIDLAATMVIKNAPQAAGSVTITNPYSLYVPNGTARFDAINAIVLGLSGEGSDQHIRKEGAGNLYIDTDTSSQELILRTNDTIRIEIDGSGNIYLASLTAGGLVRAAASTGLLSVDTTVRLPKSAANLTDANQTLQPFTDKASQYTQVTALTASRTKTLGTTTVVTGTLVRIVREDTAAFTMPIVNGGGAAGTLFTFAASPTEKQGATFFFNGSDWVLVGFEYLVS
jgi:hypothetical protein